MLRYGSFFILACLGAMMLVVPAVHADMVIPSMTHVYFDKDGVPYNGTVRYSLTCYGYTSHYGESSTPAPGSYRPDPVFHYSATCTGYGCIVYPQYYLKYRHIDWCSLDGETDEGPFTVNDTSAKPYNGLALGTPGTQWRWPEELVYDTSTENDDYLGMYYQTPEYLACKNQKNSLKNPGRNRSAELTFFTSCDSTTNSHCYSIFGGYGDVSEGLRNFTTFINATRDRIDETQFNQYLDSCDPLTDRECGGWVLDGIPLKTYSDLFPFRRNATHILKYPCDRFLVGINASLVIPENERAGGACIDSCSVAQQFFVANFSIPNTSTAVRKIPGTSGTTGILGTGLDIAGFFSWLLAPAPVKQSSSQTYDEAWIPVSANTSSIVRQSHSSVAMPDGSIILMGGFNVYVSTNDVWRSTDYGATWTEMTSWAGWPARCRQTSVVTPDGSIVMMGGRDYQYPYYMNDTWTSPDSGRTWTLVNASPGWPARTGQCSVILADGRIVMMGGYRTDRSLTIPYNDTWQSADNGRTWTLLNASSGWPPGLCDSSVAMPDGSIVLISTGDEVWRSADNGATWMQVTAHPAWAPRSGQDCVVTPDGSIILIGGEGDRGNRNDVWKSPDGGATWTREIVNPEWSFGYGHSSVIMPDGSIVLIDDRFQSRVWRLQPAR